MYTGNYWLIIAGQENKAFAAQVVFDNLANFLSIFSKPNQVLAVCLPCPCGTILPFLFPVSISAECVYGEYCTQGVCGGATVTQQADKLFE